MESNSITTRFILGNKFVPEEKKEQLKWAPLSWGEVPLLDSRNETPRISPCSGSFSAISWLALPRFKRDGDRDERKRGRDWRRYRARKRSGNITAMGERGCCCLQIYTRLHALPAFRCVMCGRSPDWPTGRPRCLHYGMWCGGRHNYFKETY